VGAQLWHHEAPWHADPRQALKALQARFLAEKYDLAALLPQELVWARQSVAAARAEGDPYGLVDQYQAKVSLLERLCKRPIPDDLDGRLTILRKICADSGEGIGNVLDVEGVSQERAVHTAERLSDEEMVRLVGTSRPTLAQARKAVYKINEELGRGECVCFPFYKGAGKGQPAGWYFVGNTID
jgi:hypothetical protein